jgi:hypothetical protein
MPSAPARYTGAHSAEKITKKAAYAPADVPTLTHPIGETLVTIGGCRWASRSGFKKRPQPAFVTVKREQQ